VETKDKKIFGGYTASTWNATSQYKTDETAFLFSISLKEKYELKKGQESKATFCHSY